MRKDELQNIAVSGAVGSTPLYGGIGKRPKVSLMSGTNFASKKDLYRAAKPGDLIFAGSPWGRNKRQNVNKAVISAVMGNPSGYHPMLVEKVNKNGSLKILELSSVEGFKRNTYHPNSPDNMTLLRPKTNVRPAVKRMGRIVDVNDRFDSLLKSKGVPESQIAKIRRSAHVGGGRRSLAIAARELYVPNITSRAPVSGAKFDASIANFERNLGSHANTIATSIKRTGKLPKKNPLSCLGGLCTDPLARAGMPIGEKSSLKFVGPNDFLRSNKYTTVGFSSAKKPKFLGSVVNKALKAGPTAIRVGTGLLAGSVAHSLLKSRRVPRSKK